MIAMLSTTGAADGHRGERERTRPAAQPEAFDRNVFDRPADQRAADECVRADRKPE